ncbi:glycosyltransferase family A protein [Zoogloea oleivorans]|nr:glycosyltransferase family 2 protein [Zoogloea oleivorans]
MLSAKILSAQLVIGITVCNQARRLPRALKSALSQTVVENGHAVVVLLDDQSTDGWRESCCELLEHPSVLVIEGICGSASRARNALLDFVDQHLPGARWVARLDADDVLASSVSVAVLCREGDESGAQYVLGSNHLAVDEELLDRSNIADPAVLLDRQRLVHFVEGFCLHGAPQELPSCNLVLRSQSGIRYPDIRSAEDHWLVASLLCLHPEKGIVVPSPIYAVYSLGGATTQDNRRSAQWALQRERLAVAVRCWLEALESQRSILGVGQEGIVWREGNRIHKRFYPWAMDADAVERLKPLCDSVGEDGPIPVVEWSIEAEGEIRCHYQWTVSSAFPATVPESTVTHFLRQLHRHGLVTSNIKRSNFRVLKDGRLIYIDVGDDIVPFTPSRFLDAAARLYSIAMLGNSDHELARRTSILRQHEALDQLAGFPRFYRSLVEGLFPHVSPMQTKVEPPEADRACDVTLLIKGCPQDAALMEDQVRHIITQLSSPKKFGKIVLAIDRYQGPYLRQFGAGDLGRVSAVAAELRSVSMVDEVWFSPTDPAEIHSTYARWFGNDLVHETHTTSGAPLFSQIWAFDQVRTRYVLQCDVDVLIGRKDVSHDFIADMLAAAQPADVLGVGFNIPQPIDGFKPYTGNFVPEIRFGLFDLERLKALQPMTNPVQEGRFEWMWHRAVQHRQQQTGMRCVRGGDSRSFYVHPRNEDKAHRSLPTWRDLIAQGIVPHEQGGEWDLVPTANWSYPARTEPLVFLMKGRDTGFAKLKRSIDSLRMQEDQRFGIIIIDDAGDFGATWFIPDLLGPLRERTTLIRRRSRSGYVRNFIEAVEVICQHDEVLVVTLDLDDVLMSWKVSSRLLSAIEDGADLIHGVMFRPDKPLHLYEPDYENPREKGGGNVWTHLRGFRKSLFQQIPKDHLRINGHWVDNVTDYAIMIPATELAQKPVFIHEDFCYYHERAPYSTERKHEQQGILRKLLAYPRLSRLPSQPDKP